MVEELSGRSHQRPDAAKDKALAEFIRFVLGPTGSGRHRDIRRRPRPPQPW